MGERQARFGVGGIELRPGGPPRRRLRRTVLALLVDQRAARVAVSRRHHCGIGATDHGADVAKDPSRVRE